MSNSKELMDKIEAMDFECEDGHLTDCTEWIELKELLEFDDDDLEAGEQEGVPPVIPAPLAEPTPVTFDDAVAAVKDGKTATLVNSDGDATWTLTPEEVSATNWQIVG